MLRVVTVQVGGRQGWVRIKSGDSVVGKGEFPFGEFSLHTYTYAYCRRQSHTLRIRKGW